MVEGTQIFVEIVGPEAFLSPLDVNRFILLTDQILSLSASFLTFNHKSQRGTLLYQSEVSLSNVLSSSMSASKRPELLMIIAHSDCQTGLDLRLCRKGSIMIKDD